MKKANSYFKIIVDTNIWISFLIGKSLNKLHYYIDSDTIGIVTCNEQIQELTEVFQKLKFQKLFTKEQIFEFFDLLEESSEIIFLKTKVDLCRDSKDNYLISLAIDAKADFLITGDNDLLVLNEVENTKIINFRDFESLVIKKIK